MRRISFTDVELNGFGKEPAEQLREKAVPLPRDAAFQIRQWDAEPRYPVLKHGSGKVKVQRP